MPPFRIAYNWRGVERVRGTPKNVPFFEDPYALSKPFGERFVAMTEDFCKAYILI